MGTPRQNRRKAEELTIGNFPDISLADARKIAREKRAEIDQHGDPAADKKCVKAWALRDWAVTRLIGISVSMATLV